MEDFLSDHAHQMARYPNRLMILLIDSDNDEERVQNARARIPDNLAERVFILGALSKPEALKRDLGSYEKIGSGMAKDCREEADETWGHLLLRHNAAELDRLREHLCPILFRPL